MGLLSFLKRENERLKAPLRAQAYHNTTASQPPVKGALPISGNATNKAPVRKHVPRRIDNNAAKKPPVEDVAIEDEVSPAPPPLVPRFTEPELRLATSHDSRPPSRPGSSHQRMVTWLKRESVGSASLSVKKQRPRSVLAPQRSVPERLSVSKEEVFFEPNPSVKPPPSRSSHQRHASLYSSITSTTAGSRGGFVDILDAQSDIKPADFRSRVQATGARDYGEDVADRNIALNPTEPLLPPPSTRASSYYAPPTTSETPFHLRRLAMSPEVSRSIYHGGHQHYAASDADEIERTNTTMSSPRPTFKVRPASSAGFAAFPSRGGTFAPRDAGNVPRPRMVGMLNSSNGGYISDYQPRGRHSRHASGSDSFAATDAASTNSRAASLSRGYQSDSRAMQRPKTSYQASQSSELGGYTPNFGRSGIMDIPGFSEDMTIRARRQRSNSRISAVSVATESLTQDWPKTARPPSRDSVVSAVPPPIRTMARRLSIASITSDNGDHKAPSRDPTEWGRIDIESSADPMMSPAPSPHVRRGDRGRHDIDSVYNYERTRSLASLKNRNKLDEIVETVPMRRSSLRHSSISSTTPTTSSMSSNPFGRPHSRHTAQTSIDIPLHSPAFTSSHTSLLESGLQTPLTSSAATIVRERSFNMDDYISSEDELDGDSFILPKKAKNPDDESLLFNDFGYGCRGTQLPGLFEAIPEIPYESPPKSASYLRHSFSNPVPLHSSPRHRTYDMEIEDDEELTRLSKETQTIGDITARVKAMRAALYEAIAEEKMGKVDVKAAVRMRKEVKAKQRAALGRKGKERLGIDVDDGHHADVE
ncbi:hypothetical protein jhhlp_004394 [Lomentospora prolificans]|uniref:Uncharacterized protein n=1 Tax=Lomentospora prolificans TaxID=41688 RepID=A0A2N3NBG3_9PEZI|nr:hypothetical protein jhhlp_004394 [Lomentospora prolificans]